MIYTYAYKISDGIRREAAIEAPSREVIFAELRKQGIKPIKVVAADGSKANGEVVVRGVRKRTVAVIAIIALFLSFSLIYLLSIRGLSPNPFRGQTPLDGTQIRGQPPDFRWGQSPNFLTDQTRRQVIGDAAVIEKGIRTGWADVFSHEGDRFLASFAIPGVKAGQRNTSVQALQECLKESKSKVEVEERKSSGSPNQNSTLHLHLSPTPNDNPPSSTPTFNRQPHPLEAQQIIAMVKGMKREARAYLAAGGTVVEYGKRLTERQDAEIAVYKRAEAEVLAAQKSMSEAAFTKFYEQRNDELRNLGIRPITLPE